MPLHQISLIYSIDFIEHLKRKKNLFLHLFYVYGYLACKCVCVSPVCLVFLEELAVRYHVGAGIPTTTQPQALS